MAQTYLKDKIYTTLKDRILSCEYPPGMILSELDFLDEFKSSRTPIHDAVVALASENLLTIIPKKGIMVTGVTEIDIIEVLDVRSIIEPAIIRKYGDLIDKVFLSDFLNRCKTVESLEDKRALDVELHHRITSVCRNKHLNDIIKSLEASSLRNRRYKSSSQRSSERIDELTAIARKLYESDYEGAAMAMETHLENAIKYAMKKFL